MCVCVIHTHTLAQCLIKTTSVSCRRCHLAMRCLLWLKGGLWRQLVNCPTGFLHMRFSRQCQMELCVFDNKLLLSNREVSGLVHGGVLMVVLNAHSQRLHETNPVSRMVVTYKMFPAVHQFHHGLNGQPFPVIVRGNTLRRVLVELSTQMETPPGFRHVASLNTSSPNLTLNVQLSVALLNQEQTPTHTHTENTTKPQPASWTSTPLPAELKKRVQNRCELYSLHTHR